MPFTKPEVITALANLLDIYLPVSKLEQACLTRAQEFPYQLINATEQLFNKTTSLSQPPDASVLRSAKWQNYSLALDKSQTRLQILQDGKVKLEAPFQRIDFGKFWAIFRQFVYGRKQRSYTWDEIGEDIFHRLSLQRTEHSPIRQVVPSMMRQIYLDFSFSEQWGLPEVSKDIAEAISCLVRGCLIENRIDAEVTIDHHTGSGSRNYMVGSNGRTDDFVSKETKLFCLNVKVETKDAEAQDAIDFDALTKTWKKYSHHLEVFNQHSKGERNFTATKQTHFFFHSFDHAIEGVPCSKSTYKQLRYGR